MTPLRLFRAVAITEAITWAGLLGGMALKYVTRTTELGVQIFGPIHGVAFIGYCLTTLLVAVDQRWRAGRLALGLVSAVPPLMTLWFDRYAERHGALADRWHSHEHSASAGQRAVRWLLRHRRTALVVFAGAVAGLTGVALLAGPPV